MTLLFEELTRLYRRMELSPNAPEHLRRTIDSIGLQVLHDALAEATEEMEGMAGMIPLAEAAETYTLTVMHGIMTRRWRLIPE